MLGMTTFMKSLTKRKSMVNTNFSQKNPLQLFAYYTSMVHTRRETFFLQAEMNLIYQRDILKVH